MLKVIQDQDFLGFKMSSEMKCVGDVVKGVKRFLADYGVTDDSAFVLATRELVNNAIEHGNRSVPDRTVSYGIKKVGDQRFMIVVKDEGEGFDHASLDLSLPEDPTQVRNRGLALVNSFADQMEFNAAGNMVTAYLAAREATFFSVEDDEGWKVVRPSGDVTAENAEAFRQLLLGLLDGGADRYRFDLALVQDMDSIILSIFIVFASMARERRPDAGLVVANANKDIANLFEMTRLDRTYQVS